MVYRYKDVKCAERLYVLYILKTALGFRQEPPDQFIQECQADSPAEPA